MKENPYFLWWSGYSKTHPHSHESGLQVLNILWRAEEGKRRERAAKNNVLHYIESNNIMNTNSCMSVSSSTCSFSCDDRPQKKKKKRAMISTNAGSAIGCKTHKFFQNQEIKDLRQNKRKLNF